MSARAGTGRLPPEIRLGAVRLQVADLDRSLAFYRDVIGFAERGRGDGRAVLGPAPTATPTLLELVEKPGARPVPATGLMGIYHFALLLPDRPALGRFVRHQAGGGVRFGAADHGFSEALYLEDPDGITIEVYADRPRDAWPADADGGYPLMSERLDAAGLMAAGGDAPWDGVPAGAVMGHMHFFVDHLERARDFYVRGLGFDPTIAVPSALFVSAGGYHHHVGLNTWRAGAPTATDNDARLIDWDLVLPDAAALENAVGRLDAAGFDARPEADPGAGGHGALVAADPWGIRVRLRHQRTVHQSTVQTPEAAS